jgi:Protein of unknown function (DUF4232)
MKVSTRRIATGISVAAAAILLPTAALASSASPAAPARPTAPACTASATEVWYGEPGDGAAGSSFFQLEFTNIGHSTCSFFGYPGVSADNIHGHIVGKPATHSGGRVLAVLTPGATAHVVLRVVDAGAICSHPLNASALRIFAPGQRASEIIGLATQGCPGTSVLHVDSIHPGTGIPGFTRR